MLSSIPFLPHFSLALQRKMEDNKLLHGSKTELKPYFSIQSTTLNRGEISSYTTNANYLQK